MTWSGVATTMGTRVQPSRTEFPVGGPASQASSGGEAEARSVRSLRDLYLFRCGFSALWVALVFTLAAAGTGSGTVSFLGGILLVAYPVSDAVATVVDLPEAIEGLVTYFRSISGEHPDWDEYRQAMIEQGKVLIRVVPEQWGPISQGGFPARLDAS